MRKNVVMMTVLMVALVFALMLVAMPAVGAGDVACDWTGTWDTCWGKMELVQTGIEKWVADVNGTAYLTLPQRTNITYKPEGKITGLVFDNTLEGWWTRYPSNTIQRTRAYTLYDYTGNLVFTISEDCNSFEGEWWYGDRYKDDWGGVWTGSREGPSKQPSKQSVCASFKPRIADASESKPAEFTIVGTEPQKVRITQPAENFDIVNVYGGKYGGIVYQRIDGNSWGSLTLEPGTYRLSCGGGGAMNLMSATVCIEYPAAKEVPPSDNQTVPPKPKEKEKPPMEEVKPSLPRGPIEKIIIRPQDNLAATELIMEIGKEKRFMAWGEDAAGNKMSVTVDEWKVSDTSIGSIDKDGLFKAGPKGGKVKIKATVKNQEGNDITGAFPITVTAEPPITFTGCVKLYDEHNQPFYPGGVEVNLFSSAYKTRKDLKQGYELNDLDWLIAQTDPKGRFEFVVPVEDSRGVDLEVDYKIEHFPFIGWKVTLSDFSLPTPPPGYKWYPNQCSNVADYLDPIPINPGSRITLTPDGLECLSLWMKKMPTSLSIDGEVTHRGKPVEKAKVRLFDNGNSVEEAESGTDGYYKLYVGNLPKGSYRLTVKQYKPKGHVTIHDWLYIKKDIWVELPLKTETKTIDIKMISWGEKVGYTGP